MPRRRRLAVILLLPVLIAADPLADLPLNAAVLEYCQSHRGDQVGDGECGSLAMAALQAAGANTRLPADAGGTVWGDEIAALSFVNGRPQVTGDWRNVQPGDILQFEGVRFAKPRGVIWTLEQHTAVVSKAAGDRRVLTTLQQNVAGERVVKEVKLRLTEMRTGTLRAYRPVR